MDVTEYIEFVALEGERFASTAEAGDLRVEIVPCPGWDMAEMVRHLGMIHLWAAANVAFPQPDPLDVDDLPDLVRYWPELTGEAGDYPDDADLVGWYRSTLANLIGVLQSAPADVEAFELLPGVTPLTMWSRRQASEIAMHRYDAEQARGIETVFDEAFATDMLDELLSGFGQRRRQLDLATEKIMHVHAKDSDEHWYLTMGPERSVTKREGSDADLSISGSASDLYILLWNRDPGASVGMSGETEIMDLWGTQFQVRWR